MLHFSYPFRQAVKRACALLLCTCLLLNLFPLLTPSAHAAEENYYLNRLVSWDIMRGDQDGNLEPERSITRAEFVTLLNRTFGYTKTGAQPFKDVELSDWYYDDISAAYTAGYFQGTEKSAASPEATLTREEAATMLCRNLMLQPQSGENLSFSDSHQASSWSRGYIKAAAEQGILRGDPDGRFRPLDAITRGEVAIMLVRVIGTPIQDPGTYSTSVSGNLMVSCSGVTLENMTVTGDLYITGGVGLGYVTLNNVTVYGKIIASGAGESNKGDCSIILKNCTAPEMIVDSPSNQYVTIRTVGNTDIDKVYVRTDTYLEGKSTGRHGFQYIEVDGEEGTRLDLAGNIHEVVAMTPECEINVGSGTVEQMTIDEYATDSTVTIAQGAVVEELNLDTATNVTGKGDIGTLNVNAPGCKVEMLPDDINIRPGITADINGTTMDTTLADQMSDSPRILSSYPRMDDIAPKQAEAAFMTNKPGTIYWAVRLSGNGEMSAGDLIKPPTYGANIVKNGNLAVKDANEVLSQVVNGLEIDTSYILSAVLVDSRGDQSPVKSVYFTTPDDSKPDFASGYPKTSTIEDTYVDFDVATTKNCTLYWAVYKKGMTAPTINEFKDGSLSGAIDFGTRKMVRSEEDSIRMGDVIETAKNALAELTDYDAYFFLTDTVNDSAVKKISFTTADRTPPVFLNNYPRISKIDKTALTGEAAINEDGKVYWAIVTHGATYPVENTALSDDEARELDYKLQIMGGMYAIKSGSFNAKENAATSFNMSGLEAETAYDIYFVAEDDSGNLSEIKVLENAKTLDQNAPTLEELRFSDANPDNIPLASTDITLVFSEDIYDRQTQMSLVEMYEQAQDEGVGTTFRIANSKDETITWEQIVRGMFTLVNLDIDDPNNNKVDYNIEYVSVSLNEDGQTEVTFANEGLGLKSGTKYQFILNNVTDSSLNLMPSNTPSESFRILDAQVNFYDLGEVTLGLPSPSNPSDNIIDAAFSMVPYGSSVDEAPNDTYYDLIIGSDKSITFELYRREYNGADKTWKKTETADPSDIFSISYGTNTPPYDWCAVSYNRTVYGTDNNQYPQLNTIDSGYEYAIHIVSIGDEGSREKWNATVNLSIFCVTGTRTNLLQLVNQRLNNETFDADLSADKIMSIGEPSPYEREIRLPNQSAPQFIATYPRAQPGDSVTTIQYQLDRDATLYYVVAPYTRLQPDGMKPDLAATGSGLAVDADHPENPNGIADIGKDTDYNKLDSEERDLDIIRPNADQIMNPSTYYSTTDGFRFYNQKYTLGSGLASFRVEELQPNMWYYIYFVLQGSFNDPSPVMCYKFNTADVAAPDLVAHAEGASNAYYSVSSKTDAIIDVNTHWALYQYASGAYPTIFDATLDDNPTTTVFKAILDDTINTYPGKITWESKRYEADAFREQLWAQMEGGTAGNPTAQGDSVTVTDVDRNGQKVENFLKTDSENMRPGVNYILVVAAKNQQGGKPVFSAVSNLHYADMNYPLIKNITSQNSTPTTDLFNGFVTVSFDKELYVMDATDKKTLYAYKARKIDAQVTGSGNAEISSSATSQFTIKVTNFPINGIINLIPTYKGKAVMESLYNSVGTPRPSILSLRLDGVYNDDGNLISAKFVIADSDLTSETNLPTT
nr:S-layer homology domain-containing protein [uncultured Agathobaculum sp.]